MCVSPKTSMEDVLALRAELEKFVTAPENKRDFQPELDIELRNLNDLGKLELRVEIRHKVSRTETIVILSEANTKQSNFANDQLRNARRNKFMVELLAVTRRIPIDPPSGGGPSFGDPANPTYSVSITDTDATGFRDEREAKDAGKRLFPKGSRLEHLLPEGVSTGLQSPAAAMIAGLTGRRNGSTAEGRRSIDDILPRRA